MCMKWLVIIIFLILLGVVYFTNAKSRGESQAQAITEKTTLTVAGKQFEVEVARTPDQLAKGLMFRESLADGKGMLFVFTPPGIHKFWMKNTLLSLDILWLNDKYEVVHLEQNVPPCTTVNCPSYGPDVPVSYVLEVNANTF